MLNNKDILKSQEIKTKFKSKWVGVDYIDSHLDILNFKKISKLFDKVKSRGVSFSVLLKILLTLPVIGVKTVHELVKDKKEELNNHCKDSLYRLLSNHRIDWRVLLICFVKQYLLRDSDFSTPKNSTKCLIFDDTDILKKGRKIEGTSKVYDHVNGSYILGFKLLVMGYWNGSVFIPVDFSFHRESKKKRNNKKYGLTQKERKKQKNTHRLKEFKTSKRFNELNMKKTDSLISMFKRIKKRNIKVDYILIDSWFTSSSLIKKIKEITSKTHLIGMYKYNSKLVVNGKIISIKSLGLRKEKYKRCRKYDYYYQEHKTEIDGIKVKVFLCKRGVNGKAHTLLSTDTNLSFVKTIEVYNIRWTIEVFFKEAKQLFRLGKCQSTNFDVQIAQTTITMIQYLLTSIRHRMESYETIGGLFKEVKQEYEEFKLNERILSIILQILSVLELFVDSIDLVGITSKIISNCEEFSFLRQNKEGLKLAY